MTSVKGEPKKGGQVTLASVKRYLEASPLGRRVPLADFKALTSEDKQDLIESLRRLSEAEREQF